MLAKISAEVLKEIGATNASEVDSKMAAFISEANQNKASMAENKTTLETLQASVTKMEGQLANLLTEAKVKEICGAATTDAISTWAVSDAGKKIISGEASRVVMEAHAAIGTVPAKPSPVGAPAAAETKTFAEIVQANVASGKTKTEAISTAVKSNPAEYQAYLKTGGKL
jgi:hypothetical protein